MDNDIEKDSSSMLKTIRFANLPMLCNRCFEACKSTNTFKVAK